MLKPAPPLLPLKRVRTSQPQGAGGGRIDWANPAAPNVGAWIGGSRGNLVTSIPTTNKNAGVFISAGASGVAFTASGQTLTGINGNGLITGITELPSKFTITCVFESFDAPSASVAYGSPLSKDQYGINWHHSDVNYRGAFTVHVGAAYQKVMLLDTTVNKVHTVVATWDGSTLAVWQNGFYAGSTAASGSLNSTITLPLTICCSSIANTYPFNGRVYFASMGRVAVQSALAKSLSDNPWQIFAQDPAELPAPLMPREVFAPLQSKRLGTTGQGPATAAIAGVRRSVRTSQPQGAVGIDWSNPLTRGLIFCAPTLPGMANDIVGGKKATTTGAVGRHVSQIGVFDLFSGTQYTDYPAFGSELSATSKCTIGWIQIPVAGSAYSTVLDMLPSGAIDRLLIYESSSDANYGFVIGTPANTTINFSSQTGLATNGVIDRYLLRFTAALNAATSADTTLFRNQSKLTTANSSSLSRSSTSTNRWGAAAPGSDKFEGVLGLRVVWNRALSDAEALSYNANPYQIFLPDTTKVWVPA